MSVKEALLEQGVEVRRFEYDDRIELVADFGPLGEESVEIVDDTVIAVADDMQYDVEIEGDAQAFINNGVLTIEVKE